MDLEDPGLGDTNLPHGVQEGAVVHQAQQLVGCCHVMSNRFLPVVEEGIRSPDLTGQQVVQGKYFHGTIKLQPFISPGLPEKDINSVFLCGERKNKSCFTQLFIANKLLQEMIHLFGHRACVWSLTLF